MNRFGWILLVGLFGCPGTSPPPGDEQMGRYSFHAERDAGQPDAGQCQFVEIPGGGFDFEASFSRFRDAGLYYVTIGGVAHDATWDGQRLRATYTAQRNFSQCSCGRADAGSRTVVTMEETIDVVIVSQSQSEAAGGCVETPPVDPDAGIVRPDTTPGGGFDAVRACGTLSEHVSVMPPVTTEATDCLLLCNSCSLGYFITGDRR